MWKVSFFECFSCPCTQIGLSKFLPSWPNNRLRRIPLCWALVSYSSIPCKYSWLFLSCYGLVGAEFFPNSFVFSSFVISLLSGLEYPYSGPSVYWRGILRYRAGASSALAMDVLSFAAFLFPFIAGRGGSFSYPLTNPMEGTKSGGELNTSSNKNAQVLKTNEEYYEKLSSKKKFDLQQLLTEENLRLVRLSLIDSLSGTFLDYPFLVFSKIMVEWLVLQAWSFGRTILRGCEEEGGPLGRSPEDSHRKMAMHGPSIGAPSIATRAPLPRLRSSVLVEDPAVIGSKRSAATTTPRIVFQEPTLGGLSSPLAPTSLALVLAVPLRAVTSLAFSTLAATRTYRGRPLCNALRGPMLTSPVVGKVMLV